MVEASGPSVLADGGESLGPISSLCVRSVSNRHTGFNKQTGFQLLEKEMVEAAGVEPVELE
jgi:hypothetical protein